MPCTACVLPGRLAEQLAVRPQFLNALIAAGKLTTHDHGVTTITKDAADELRWHIAEHRAEQQTA